MQNICLTSNFVVKKVWYSSILWYDIVMKDKILNIVLISLDSCFVKNVSQIIASMLDIHFADCKELVEYDLIDSGTILKNCGIDYLKEREGVALKRALDFENTILSCDYDLFKNNKRLFSKNLVCYLKLPQKDIGEKDVINRLAFLSHDEFLEKNCDKVCTLKSKNVKQAVKKTIEVLGECYEN